MSKLTRRTALIGGVGAAAALTGATAWGLDRFLIEHAEVTNVSELEAQASSSASVSPGTSAATEIDINTWTSGSGSSLVTGYVADIKVPSATSVRSAFAEDTFGTNIIEYPTAIASRVGATLAINGDYYGFRDTGIVVRNGVAYRDEPTRTALVLYVGGEMRLVDETTTSADQLIANGAWQVWSFGPGLVDGGKVMNGIEDMEVDTNIGNHSIQGVQPRTGIGMIEPNHFLFIVVDGRSTGYSAGINMTDFAQLFADQGASVAYNLDGGGSSAMVYQKSLVNKPLGRNKERGTSDIIWVG
ncbi:hypothetical protein HMPREF1531_01847 [Propionibacterium sp. oral taxon 192 str. F0372]|uniref:phosphodiester glycosidase family protein n=1 Tax=Propionibacterium sp. oral taxon 192 TaxID=671222 RepID=UPI00035419E5|nr:phosphodiester glycosidase family protein [Propionibacterium sp. oral taxon 192]EPH02539.1 hypothetical protein HMPREF1531_01847 [Propionibacterium sp. oral taxon 192 str. F0372]